MHYGTPNETPAKGRGIEKPPFQLSSIPAEKGTATQRIYGKEANTMRSSSFTKPTIDILTIDEFWRDGQRGQEFEASL